LGGLILLSEQKIKALQQRWENQSDRIQKIADSIIKGEDWTVHLEGLPNLDELEKLPNEKYPRDLRGVNLRRYLQATTTIEPAESEDAPNIAYIIREAMENDTPLRGKSPFPTPNLSAEDITMAIERGCRFFMAMQVNKVIGAVQIDSASEYKHNTNNEPYYEISNVSMLPAYRHQGIGGAIIAEAEKFIKNEAKHKWILIRVIAELGFEEYYTRLGYARKEVYVRQQRKGAPAFMEIIMTKKL
jgi:predicted N-acetyltransferase YhbS